MADNRPQGDRLPMGRRPDQQYNPPNTVTPAGGKQGVFRARELIILPGGQGVIFYHLPLSGGIIQTTDAIGPNFVPGVLITSPSDEIAAADNSQAVIGLVGSNAASTVGPYTYFGSSQVGSSNIESSLAMVVGSLGYSRGGVPGGDLVPNNGIVYAPSGGDDADTINGYIADGNVVQLLSNGTYKANTGPIIIDTAGGSLRGPAWGRCAINCGFTSAQDAMLIMGQTAIVTRPFCDNVTFNVSGNANCMHGVIVRAEQPYMSNVEVQNMNSAGDMVHCSPSDLTGLAKDTYEFYNVFGSNNAAAGNGMTLDHLVTSSEFWGCHFNGAVLPSLSGGYGITDAGTGNKFFGCHPYAWTSGAYLGTGQGPLIVGGEYENCGGPNITLNGVKYGCVLKAQSYGTHNTGPDILLENGANYNQLDGIRHNSTAVSELYSLDGTCFHNSIVNAKSFVAIAAAVNAAAAADYQIITLNDFQGATITHSGAHDYVPAGSNL